MPSLNETELAYYAGANTNPTVPGVDVVPPSPPQADVTTVTLDGTTSKQVLALRTQGLGRTIYNGTGQQVYLKFGTAASATSFTTLLAAGAYYEVPFYYDGIIHAFSTAASAVPHLQVTELHY
jgi:hypothetical protein